MNKITKLIILIFLSCSVYFIYQQTKNSVVTITNIGDNLALGINPYGIKETSYSDYIKDYLNKDTEKVIINNEFSNKELSIKTFLEQVKNNPNLKKNLMESNTIILNIGYNDLLYKLSLKEKIDSSTLNEIIREISNDYNELIKEIRKYYKRNIITIGYYCSNKNDYYLNKGIRKLNETLSQTNEIEFIDTYYLLSDRTKYFPNPNINYPNRLGYQQISEKIIRKILEK